MMGPQLAPTTYQERHNLLASTVVTQYRLDKAGMRSCLQDDVTLSDRQPLMRLLAAQWCPSSRVRHAAAC